MNENKRFTYSASFNGFCDVYDNNKILSCMRLEYVENTVNLLNELNDEKNELRLQLNLCSDQRNEFHHGARENANLVGKLEEENGQLKQRNDRQAKRLAELYELMAKKDWESLTEIIDDFCSCEEQLQRESRTYSDFE